MPQNTGEVARNSRALWARIRSGKETIHAETWALNVLINTAMGGSSELWLEIGNHLIRMQERGELGRELSERFVAHCPESVFKELAAVLTLQRPHTTWEERARKFRNQVAIDFDKNLHWKQRQRHSKSRSARR